MPYKLTITIAGLILLVEGLIGTGIYVLWASLDPIRQSLLAQALDEQSIGLAILFAVLLAALVGTIAHRFFAFYVTPVQRLSETVRVIAEVNAAHRAQDGGAAEVAHLSRSINALAERHQALQRDIEVRIAAANARLQEEKNRLAALMSEFTQGVVVCNQHGRILLYNHRARRMFNPLRASAQGALIGLGRSIYGIADRGLVIHSLESIVTRLARGDANPMAQFVLSAPGGQLLRAQMAPIVNGERHVDGFVLSLENVTDTIAEGSKRDVATLMLMESSRGALGNIRAAIETLLEYPDMALEKREQFTAIIRQEALSLSRRLDASMEEFAAYLKAQWPLETMLARDLVSAVQRQLQDRFAIASSLQAPDEALWIKVESYSVAHALLWVAHRIRVELEVGTIEFRLTAAGRFVRCDIGWHGRMIDVDTARGWEHHSLLVLGEGSPLTLREVAERHGGEVWFQADRDAGYAFLRLLLPTSTAETIEEAPPLPGERPEYYDFDLFNQPGQTPELDETPLANLLYTVFDTETTGLDPAHGDEIISIGAVRIVNKRLLRQECFDQLIDPERTPSAASIEVHGITPDQLSGKPLIAQVLPAFARFAEDTVLVAHNAAFDMRFLQLKEQATGVRFIQPVLDTLLLSAVVHPYAASHSLEAIASRLGVAVNGRHTAIGDATLTAEVFLKLLPLLAAKDIHTLGQARLAAQRTYFARISY